jgi:SAM-dependent methyltransferase
VVERAGENASSAGISSSEADVAAIFERLKREVRKQPGSAAEGAGHATARADAERYWAVAADVPIRPRPGLRGRLAATLRRSLRPLMSWYVAPFATDQRSFNRQVLTLVDELNERFERFDQRLARTESIVSAVEQRLGPMREPALEEAALTEPVSSTVAEIRERRQVYVEDFRDGGPVLDLACGRGEFLSLLAEVGIEARGVDRDPDLVAIASRNGVDAVEGDILEYLDQLEDSALGGIFSAHLLEELPPRQLVRLLEHGARALRPGGLFVAETINPHAAVPLRTSLTDPAGVGPLPPRALRALVQQAGLRVEEIRCANEPEQRLRPVELDDEGAGEALAHNLALLNERVFPPVDYAIVARRP